MTVLHRKMKKAQDTPDKKLKKERIRRAMERTATFGLLLLAIGLVAPFTNLSNTALLSAFKWIFAAGSMIYLLARIFGGTDPQASVRLRRLRRMEVWAGVAFCTATFFWFYNTSRYPYMSLAVMRDTVVFTLAGALIQIIAAWMIASQMKKEGGNPFDRK